MTARRTAHPGKWVVDIDVSEDGPMVFHKKGRPVAQTYAIEDAALIVAAPDLLGVIEEYLRYNRDYASSLPTEAWVEKARTAAAKARNIK